jgi:hypothetical protein
MKFRRTWTALVDCKKIPVVPPDRSLLKNTAPSNLEKVIADGYILKTNRCINAIAKALESNFLNENMFQRKISMSTALVT